MNKLVAWLRQPTTVAGISALIGTALALVLKQMSVAAAVPLLTGAAVSMVLPDNTGAKADAQAVAAALVGGIASGKFDPIAIAPQIAALATDVEGATTTATVTLTAQK